MKRPEIKRTIIRSVMKRLGLSIVLGVFATHAVAHRVQSKAVAQLRVQKQALVCVDFVDGGGSCGPTAYLSLINTDKAYYHFGLHQQGSPVDVYFFYAGVYKLKFKCRAAGSGNKGKSAQEMDRVVYLQGGHQYSAAPVLPFGDSDSRCKLKIQQER